MNTSRMELSRMAAGIIKKIDKQYEKMDDDDCLDLFQIKDICRIYKIKPNTDKSISLSEINISSPSLRKMAPKENKRHIDILKSSEFSTKYALFIKTIYACLKINLEIFDIKGGTMTLKNNYQLIRALEFKKKQLLLEHIGILRLKCKNITQNLGTEYEDYAQDFQNRIKIIDRILLIINKLIKCKIFEKTDNLLTLILPFFYTYTEFIEEYN